MQPSPRELRSLPRLLGAAFRSSWSAALGALSFAATVGAWFLGSGSNVPLFWFVALASISVLVAATLFEATRRAFENAARPLPDVRLAIDEASNGGGIVLVLDESPLFSISMAVSMFAIEHGDYEARLGTGFVDTIREDGRIQVRIVNLERGREDVLQRLRQSDAATLKNIRVKPFLSWQPVSSGAAAP